MEVLVMLLNYLAMAEILTKLGCQDIIMDAIAWKKAIQLDGRVVTAADFVLEFGWSEHSYKHKNQWFSWAEKLAQSKCWNPQVPTGCEVYFLCDHLTRGDVDFQRTPIYITYGLAFSICGVLVDQWNGGNGLILFQTNILKVLPRRLSNNCVAHLKSSL